MAVKKQSNLNQLFAVEMANKKALESAPGLRFLLVVDDNKEQRDYVLKCLGDSYPILQAVSSQKALEIMKVSPVDLVLISTELPNNEGVELLARLRVDPQTQNLPIMFMAPEEKKVQALLDGADDCLASPFVPEELVARVRILARIRSYQLRLENELRAARKIQQSLLPPDTTEFEGGRFEFLYHPCDELSGDFVDLITYPDGLFVYLADVTSHGAAAAQVTYLVRSLIREVMRNGGERLTPAEILVRAGSRFKELGLDQWVGITALKLNLATRELAVAQANAPMPFLLSGGESHPVAAKPSPIFGDGSVQLSLEAHNAHVTLKPGDAIFMYTDGAYEFSIGGGHRPYGERRLTELFKHANGANWRSSVMHGLTKVNGSDQFADDVTVGRLSIET